MTDDVMRTGTPAEMMEAFAAQLAENEAAGVPTYPPGGATMGKWVQAKIGDAEYLTHMSIEVDPRDVTRVLKYVVVVYEEPSLSARYARGESLWSFDEALGRAAGLVGSNPALPAEVDG